MKTDVKTEKEKWADWMLDAYKSTNLDGQAKEDFMIGVIASVATEYILNIYWDTIREMDVDEDVKGDMDYLTAKFAEYTHEYRCNYYKHIPEEEGGFKVDMEIKTVKDLLKENENLMEADIYRFYDVKDDGTKIVNIYSMGEEGGIAGVEYEDGTYYIVGCRTDREVETRKEMLLIVENSI